MTGTRLLSSVFVKTIESLSNHDDDGNKNPTNLYIWQWKTVFLHALHVHFSFFDILETFSFFLRRQMTCSAVVWTTWAYDDKCSILSSYAPSAGSSSIPGQNTLNNWKMIAETQVTFSGNVLTQLQNRSFHVVERTKMSKNEKCTCKACKNTVFHCQICKFVGGFVAVVVVVA